MTAYVTFDLDDNKPPEATLITGSGHPPFVRVNLLPTVKAFVHTRAQCDALVRAALAARDLLPEPDPGQCGADWGSATTSQSCTLPAGHDGNHIDSAGHAWGDVPGETPAAFCAEQHPDGFLCTRPAGHDGDHQAHGGAETVAWLDEAVAIITPASTS